jgi:hypothetical protein
VRNYRPTSLLHHQSKRKQHIMSTTPPNVDKNDEMRQQQHHSYNKIQSNATTSQYQYVQTQRDNNTLLPPPPDFLQPVPINSQLYSYEMYSTFHKSHNDMNTCNSRNHSYVTNTGTHHIKQPTSSPPAMDMDNILPPIQTNFSDDPYSSSQVLTNPNFVPSQIYDYSTTDSSHSSGTSSTISSISSNSSVRTSSSNSSSTLSSPLSGSSSASSTYSPASNLFSTLKIVDQTEEQSKGNSTPVNFPPFIQTDDGHFQCDVCSRMFKRKSDLKGKSTTYSIFCVFTLSSIVHVRTHTGERPYVCEVCIYIHCCYCYSHSSIQIQGCERSFTTASNLRRHHRNVHNNNNNNSS